MSSSILQARDFCGLELSTTDYLRKFYPFADERSKANDWKRPGPIPLTA